MTSDELKSRVDSIKDYVIFSNTRVNYLEQLHRLIAENNHVIMVHQSFFAMVLRDMNGALILSIRALVENRRDTHNIKTLTKALRASCGNEGVFRALAPQLEPMLAKLESLAKDKIAADAQRVASATVAHKSLKQLANLPLPYVALRVFLKDVGDVLNDITGLLWDTGTVMHIGNDDDSFSEDFRRMELSDLIGSHLLYLNDSHEAVHRARRVLGKK